jgi:lysozyme
LITDFEGFPNGGRPYNDPVGLATVGYGHLIARRPVIAADRRAMWLRDQKTAGVLTQAEAEELLRRDLAPREAAVLDLVHVQMTQGQFDAVGSLVLNICTGNFAISTVLRRLNAGDFRGAADAFLKWNEAGTPPVALAGLTRRRQAERALFLSDGAGASPGPGPEPDPLAGYTAAEIHWIREYDRLRREQRDPATRVVLRTAMTRQRKRIWRAAQASVNGGDGKGWDWNRRRDRYHSLLERST